jgi:hypothetical protein
MGWRELGERTALGRSRSSALAGSVRELLAGQTVGAVPALEPPLHTTAAVHSTLVAVTYWLGARCDRSIASLRHLLSSICAGS